MPFVVDADNGFDAWWLTIRGYSSRVQYCVVKGESVLAILVNGLSTELEVVIRRWMDDVAKTSLRMTQISTCNRTFFLLP